MQSTEALKPALRRRLRRLRDRLDPTLRSAYSADACRQIMRLAAYENADTVALYSAFGSELDVSAVAEHARRAGKRVALPRLEPEGDMRFVVQVADAPLVMSPLGIAEPGPEAPILTASELQLAILPGIAFDDRGHRLGYGGGYYDRALAQAPHAFRLGVAFELQIVPGVPTLPHDLPVHALVTEARADVFE